MVASRERRHGNRVARLDKYRMRILPITAIYGGNASGKTNFFKALDFAGDLVVNGTHPDVEIGVDSFKLDDRMIKQPSRFSFELLIDGTIYEFSFSVTRKAVLEEKLVRINSASEKILYERHYKEEIEFDDSLIDRPFLQFVSQGTRDNQLFLTNSVSQNATHFRPVYDWFRDSLQLVAPDSRFEPFEKFLDEEDPLYSTMNEWLSHLDTGIVRLGGEDVPLENIPLPEALMQERLKEGETIRLWTEPRYLVTRKVGKLVAQKLVTYHSKMDGTEAKFEFHQEADGSKRVIELLPAFLELSAKNSKRVFVIDELDRSLHSMLTRWLLETYLAGCTSETRAQLLLTTHNVQLIDKQLLRRDEMWVAQRDGFGSSTLYSLSEYENTRYDPDIRRSYLQGRMGGIPQILLDTI